MQNAIAFCDNDVVVAAWSYGAKLTGCMGFAVQGTSKGNIKVAQLRFWLSALPAS